jgi:hypothetical protein
MEPARVAKENGIDIEVRNYLNAETIGDSIHRILDEGYDLVIYQRPLDKMLVDSIPFFQKMGTKVIVELDDDLERTPPSNVAYSAVHPGANPKSNWNHLKRACSLADAMIVSTPSLQRYKPGKAIVIRNKVPVWTTEIDHQKGQGLGWSGTLAVHAEDLHETRGALASYEMMIIGEKKGVKEVLRLEKEPHETGWLSIDEYLAAVGELDVGIAPLALTTFNRGKSYLKILEYAAGGTPFVCSPTPEYEYFVEKSGCGFVARKFKDWRRYVDMLMTDEALRATQGALARDYVKRNCTIEGGIEEWVDAWRSVLA